MGRVECIGHAVDAGANLNCRDEGDLTPLLLASKMGYANCVNYLIDTVIWVLDDPYLEDCDLYHTNI